MKLLLDMGLAAGTAAFLRNAGHDAVHLREQGLQRLPDADILSKAVSEGRVIVTFDLEFSAMVALQKRQRPSIVLFRLQDLSTDKVNLLLLDVLGSHQQALHAGAIVVVEPDRIRTRLLPIS